MAFRIDWRGSGPREMPSRARRRIARAVRLGIGIALLATWFTWLRPTGLGGSTTYLLVRGTSMLPTYANGDLLVLRPEAPHGVGDAVAYRVAVGEIGAGHLVIHRIVGGAPGTGFDLQGDNNDSIDPWHPRASDVVGGVWLVLPGLGRILTTLRQPIILGALAAAVVVAWFVAGAFTTAGSAGGPDTHRRRTASRWVRPTG